MHSCSWPRRSSSGFVALNMLSLLHLWRLHLLWVSSFSGLSSASLCPTLGFSSEIKNTVSGNSSWSGLLTLEGESVKEQISWCATVSLTVKCRPYTSQFQPGTVSAPAKSQLLHFSLQLSLPRLAAGEKSQPLLQAAVLAGCQLNLLLCSLSAAPLHSYLVFKRLDRTLQSYLLLLGVSMSVSVVERVLRRPQSFHVQAFVG